MMTATWYKLKDGAWGVRVSGAAKTADKVQATNKAGQVKEVMVAKVLWHGDGVSLCTIVSDRPAATSKSSGTFSRKTDASGYAIRRGCRACPVCGEELGAADRSCWECGASR